MLLSIVSVVLTLATLVIYCGMSIEVYYRKKNSFWLKDKFNSNLWVVEGFNIEIFMLIGLIFDLYKWQLFIAMTKEYDSSIKNRLELEAKILKTKITIYYIFIGVASIVVLTYVTLVTGYLASSNQE